MGKFSGNKSGQVEIPEAFCRQSHTIRANADVEKRCRITTGTGQKIRINAVEDLVIRLPKKIAKARSH
jgi:hypothetical protein